MYKYCRYCMETVDMRNHICPSKPKPKVNYKAKKENQSDKTARDLAETKNKLLQLKERKLDVVNMW